MKCLAQHLAYSKSQINGSSSIPGTLLGRGTLAWTHQPSRYCPLSLLPFMSSHPSLRGFCVFSPPPSLSPSANHSYQHFTPLTPPPSSGSPGPHTPLVFPSTSRLQLLFPLQPPSSPARPPARSWALCLHSRREISAWPRVFNSSWALKSPKRKTCFSLHSVLLCQQIYRLSTPSNSDTHCLTLAQTHR